MKLLFVFFLVLAINFVFSAELTQHLTAADPIKCYVCFYSNPPKKGIPNDPDCYNITSNKYFQECTEETVIPNDLQTSNLRNESDISVNLSNQKRFSCKAESLSEKNSDQVHRRCVPYVPIFMDDRFYSTDTYVSRVVTCSFNRCNDMEPYKFEGTGTSKSSKCTEHSLLLLYFNMVLYKAFTVWQNY